MDVKVCKVCKKMFQYIAGAEICPNCRRKEEELFQKVKDYLRENPGADMIEVNEATEVSVSLIEKFLREGRLQVSADSPIALACERCGRRIMTGRLCIECKKQIAGDLDEMKKSLAETYRNDNRGAKMRYLTSDKRH